jgi:hypothetical protein
MIKWLGLLFSFFLGRFNKPSTSLKDLAIEVFDELSFKSRKLISLSLTALGSVILFCGGLLILIMESASQYDHLGYLTWTAMLASGVGLLIFSAFIFAGVFLFAWPPPQHQAAKVETATAQQHPLESALAELVLSFTESRRQSSPFSKTQQRAYEGTPDEPSQMHH